MRCGVALALLVLVSQPRDLQIAPAADYLVRAFDRVPLVAFSEPGHGAAGTREFLASVIAHPQFAGRVNDVVVEFGNARYQGLADRYVGGDAVPREQLRQIWEDTTVVSGIWTAPMYEGFLDDVRSLNRRLTRDTQIRVVLGDPPIDWSVVRGPADEDMNDWRDAHFAWAVEHHVLKKRRRALLWIGGAHLSRRVLFPESLIHLLDRRFPGQTAVAVALDRPDLDGDVAARIGPWPSLAAADVRGTWIGRLESRAVGWRLSTGTVEENVDAVVFWEHPRRGADEMPRVDPDSAAGRELRRRQRLHEGTIAFRGGRIRFAAGSAALMPDSEAALTEVVAELRRDTDLTLLVKAFADAREAEADRLSRERARRVVEWLVAKGVSRARLEPLGCGASRALWFGHSEAERAANRKADLVRRSKWDGCEPPATFDWRE